MKPQVVFGLVAAGAVLAGCGPDLVVTDFQATGAATTNAQNSVEVPVQVVVRNQGDRPAGTFKVSTQYTGGAIDPASEFVVAFSVPGQANTFYPFTGAPLAAGASVPFSGKLIFNPAEHGANVSVTARADSCSGDEFMPAYCRVRESNEGNNLSSSAAVALP